MLSFVNDYSEGCAPQILEALAAHNLTPEPGYGDDPVCDRARTKIREACADDSADVYFLCGGTQTNAVVIDSMLASYEGVVACTTGHVALHEAGAIEASGHKVLTVPGHDGGKMAARDLRALLAAFYADGSHEHMVFPGMAYISQPTEYGTLYTRAELQELRAVCNEYDIPLYVDGARLGYALATPGSDVDLPCLTELADAFYIGGTKVGALFGEAVVFPRHGAPRHFPTQAKRHGALLAKGFVLGLQYDTLFTDDLYLRLGANGVTRAEQLRTALVERGYTFHANSPTNQTFVVLSNERLAELGEHVAYEVWEPVDATHTAIRLCTSWATTQEQVDELISYL